MKRFRFAITLALLLQTTVVCVAQRPSGIGERPGRPGGAGRPRPIDGPKVGDDYIKAFPAAKQGMQRYVIELPQKNDGDESGYMVEIIVGKVLIVDGVNQIWFLSQIETKVVPGWGFSYYEVAKLNERGSTAMRPPPGAEKVERFIKTQSLKVPYNSRLPVVVYVPEDGEIRYRIWTAGEVEQAAPDDHRHVPLAGQPNFRDVGGYQTDDGKTVRRGVVFRSGELPRLTDDDVAKLQQLGIKTCVNFLTEIETESRGADRLPPGAREVSLPIETDDGLAASIEKARQAADFSAMPPSINPEIHRVLVDDARQQYAALLKEIAHTDEPLVYHCSHGIHRTGTATAVLLWGLGVPWETVREDYLLSNKYRAAEVEERLEQLRQAVANKQNIAPDEVDMTNIEAFYIQQGSYIDATRDEILKKYGSIDGYLTNGLGLTDAEIAKLRARLLE